MGLFDIFNADEGKEGQPKPITESKIGNAAILSALTSFIGIIGSIAGWELSGTDIATISSTLTSIIAGLIWYFRKYKTVRPIE